MHRASEEETFTINNTQIGSLLLLKDLDVSSNVLQELPISITNLRNLQKLNLAENQKGLDWFVIPTFAGKQKKKKEIIHSSLNLMDRQHPNNH